MKAYAPEPYPTVQKIDAKFSNYSMYSMALSVNITSVDSTLLVMCFKAAHCRKCSALCSSSHCWTCSSSVTRKSATCWVLSAVVQRRVHTRCRLLSRHCGATLLLVHRNRLTRRHSSSLDSATCRVLVLQQRKHTCINAPNANYVAAVNE